VQPCERATVTDGRARLRAPPPPLLLLLLLSPAAAGASRQANDDMALLLPDVGEPALLRAMRNISPAVWHTDAELEPSVCAGAAAAATHSKSGEPPHAVLGLSSCAAAGCCGEGGESRLRRRVPPPASRGWQSAGSRISCPIWHLVARAVVQRLSSNGGLPLRLARPPSGTPRRHAHAASLAALNGPAQPGENQKVSGWCSEA